MNQEFEKKTINAIPMEKGKLTLQLTDIKPANHRLFVVPYVEPEKIAKSGLVLPSHLTVKDKHKNDISIERLRYFVSAVSEDLSMDINIGDEVYPLIFDGVTLIQLPSIIDFNNDNFQFLVMHETEIMGYKSNTRKKEE
jgi:co-chaperonin GroES (HSP10)